jgi:hypothetical protein
MPAFFFTSSPKRKKKSLKRPCWDIVFLTNADAGTTASALDDAIEDWFKKTYAVPVDFEIEDALAKLTRLKLCKSTGKDDTGAPVWTAVPLSEACERLDVMWDNFFTRV